MRNVTSLACVALLLSIASCAHRPNDQRVDVKTAMLPEVASNDKAFSSYQPAKPFALYSGLLERTVFQAAATAGARVEVLDWKVPPGKQSDSMNLPGAAFIEVRSGSGTLQTVGETQPLQSGAVVSVSQDQSFTLANSGELMLTLRVYTVTGS